VTEGLQVDRRAQRTRPRPNVRAFTQDLHVVEAIVADQPRDVSDGTSALAIQLGSRAATTRWGRRPRGDTGLSVRGLPRAPAQGTIVAGNRWPPFRRCSVWEPGALRRPTDRFEALWTSPRSDRNMLGSAETTGISKCNLMDSERLADLHAQSPRLVEGRLRGPRSWVGGPARRRTRPSAVHDPEPSQTRSLDGSEMSRRRQVAANRVSRAT
jgi:hypothetical protein